MKKYHSIFPSEIEDFETECRVKGFNPDEFILKEHDVKHTPESAPIFNINGQITITRKSISRTYNTGNATHWVADFADDLRADVFNNS